MRAISAVSALLCVLAMSSLVSADPAPPLYKPGYKYPVFDEIREAREARRAARDSLRDLVDQRYEDEKEREDDERLDLRLDWTGIERPSGPEAFHPCFHFPPVAQYATGTCWAFSGTSFFESEVARTTGQQIKLSEMWTVYWEWVEMARRYVREYGHSNLGPGSQSHGAREIYRLHGAVPASAYPGILSADGRHDHEELVEELYSYLGWIKDEDLWHEDEVTLGVRAILDRHLGPVPERCDHGGRSYTPREFLDEVLRLDPDDYIEVVSTLREPFGSWVRLDVHDNWRRRGDYLNLPLDDFYEVMRSSLQAGYTVEFGGDVSEPGMDGLEGAAVIPSWDIPAKYIDQASREYRIANETTSDDHGVHLVGFLEHGGREWFLAKDSSRSSRLGRFPGYYFYDGDYVRLKTLACMVHRERLVGRLPEDPAPPQ